MNNHVATKMLPANLVALMYADNSCYTSVTDQAIEGLTIDIEKGIWNYQRPKDQFQNTQILKIGECNHAMKNCSSGVIGIYDRSVTQHLSLMVRHSQEMTTEDREYKIQRKYK